MTQFGSEPRENSPSSPGKSAATVLVVDDEPLARWSIAEVLGEQGYRVSQAGDAASALQALAVADKVPDVLLLDLRLPNSKDLTALSVIHRFFPRIAIVLMSAYGSQDLFAEALRRGAAAVLDKPFEIGDLGLLVERALAVGSC